MFVDDGIRLIDIAIGHFPHTPIAVGTGTWGIAAVIPKYLSLRLRAKSTLKKQFPIKKFGRFNKKHYLCTH